MKKGAPNFQVKLDHAQQILDDLDDSERLAIWDAVATFALSGTTLTFPDRYMNRLYLQMCETITDGRDAYQERCEKAKKSVSARWSKKPETQSAQGNSDSGDTNVYERTAQDTDVYGRIRTYTNVDNRIDKNGIERNGIESKEKIIKKESEPEPDPKPKTPSRKALWKSMVEDRAKTPEEKKALMDFYDMRQVIGKPMSEGAMERTFRDLDKLSSNPQERVDIIYQSVQASYQGLFPLRKARNQGTDSTGIKKVQEQAYEQRENTEHSGTDTPEWLRRELLQ